MKNEYKAYRFFIMLFVVLVANTALIVSEGRAYYLWFFSSILLLLVLTIIEIEKGVEIIKNRTNFRINRNWAYLLILLISYPFHYRGARYLNFNYVILFQVVNTLMFFFVYCLEKKNFEKNSRNKIAD